MPDRKTRVLITAAGLHFGGAEVVIRSLVNTIDRRIFDVAVCCIKARGAIGEELARNGVDVTTLSEQDGNGVEYLTFLKLRRLIREKGIDVVHTHSTDALADAAVCRLLNRRLRLVHTYHYGNYPHADKSKMRLEKLFSPFADRLVAVGDVQRRQIADAFGIRESKIARVWNGIPLESAATDGGFRVSVGANGRILIGTIATLIPQKGLFDLLNVADRLRQINPMVLFVVVGDGPLRPQLEAKRAQLNLQDNVVFAGWIKDASRVAMPDFDVFFQPSLWEAMSIAVLEAMATGRPIVATRVGENPRMIRHHVDGMLVEPGNVAEMTSTLARVVADADLRSRLGSAAAMQVMDRFTLSQMTRAYETIYSECAQK